MTKMKPTVNHSGYFTTVNLLIADLCLNPKDNAQTLSMELDHFQGLLEIVNLLIADLCLNPKDNAQTFSTLVGDMRARRNYQARVDALSAAIQGYSL
jgi:hypothetical protein